MSDKSAIQQSNLPIVWVLGGPGSGKGTQCEQINSKFSYSHLSTGELLRNAVMSGTPKGLQLFKIMEQGQLVPDEEVVDLLSQAIVSKINAGNTKGFLIDGFPANQAQASLFEKKVGTPTKIIVIEVNEIVLAERLKGRGNFDDTPEAIEKRIQNFVENTRPVIEAYKTKLKQINGDRKTDEVFVDVSKYLQE